MPSRRRPRHVLYAIHRPVKLSQDVLFDALQADSECRNTARSFPAPDPS